MNTKLIALPERAIEAAGKWGGDLLELGSELGTRGGKWLEAGAKLGALRSGTKVATTLVRRHPVAAVATVAGAGLLWYLARRKAKAAENGNGEVIEGSARRVEARRKTNGGTARKTTTRARKRTTTDANA